MINKKIIIKIFFTIFYSIIFAIGLQIFIQPSNLLTTGIAGVSQIVQQLTGLQYGIIYLLLNLPGIVVGYFYVGKVFTYYSILSIITVTVTTIFLPVTSITPNEDILLNAIFGGIIIGYSLGSLLKIGASSGGTDFFAVYLLKYKNIEFAKVNLLINISIIILGVLFNNIEIGLYTIVSLYVRNNVLDQVFTNTQKITLFIVGPTLEEVSEYINENLHRGTTIIKNAEGGYTKNKKEIIMTTVNKYEYSLLLDEIGKINRNIFINVIESKQVVGNYQITKDENET